jgi:hypothetical protein
VIKESLVEVSLTLVLAGLLGELRAEGSPISKILLKPFGSNLVTLDFTILTALIHSPEIELPVNWK